MATLPLTFSLAPFYTGAALDANSWAQQFIYNLQGFGSGNFVTGQSIDNPDITSWNSTANFWDTWNSSIDVWGSTPPSQSDIGPWFDGSQWWAWDGIQHRYEPITQSPRVSPVMNGQTQVWQRNTSISATGYSADRYKLAFNLSTGTLTSSQNNIALPSSSLYPFTEYSVRLTVTAPESVLGTSEYAEVFQAVERQFALPMFGVRTSLSILLQSSVAGTYCVSIRSGDFAVSFVKECVLTATNTPQYFQIENIPPFPAATYGTLDTDAGYYISVCAGAGTTYQASLSGIWSTGNFLATANQTNLFATNGATLDFTLLQHENGPTCSQFMWTPFDQDRERCQRYYYKSIDYGLYAGATGANVMWVTPVQSTSTQVCLLPPLMYAVPLRVIPSLGTTLSIYSRNSGTSNKVYYTGTASDITVTSTTTEASMISVIFIGSAPATGNFIEFYVIADVDF